MKNIRNNPSENVFTNSSIISMVVLVIFIGFGEKMAERFLPLYIIALGGGAIAVALLNSLDNLLSALYSYPGGYIADKFGHKKALIIFTIIALIGYLIVIFIPIWQAVIIGAFFFISWTAITLPAVMSLVSKTVSKKKRVTGVTIHSFVRRIPMALGPIAGGFLIKIYGKINGVKIAFIIASILAVFSIIFVYYFMPDVEIKKKKSLKFQDTVRNIKGSLLTLLISDILIRFAEQIPYAFVVVWVVNINKFSALQFGFLTTIEMVTAMFIYLPVAYFADKGRKKPFVVTTFIFFSLFPLILIFSRSFEMLIIAFIIRGMKEFGEPTRKALILDLAPEDLKAGTFGVYYLIRDIVVSIAAFSAAFLWKISPIVNFLVAFGFGVIGTIFFAIFGKEDEKKHIYQN